MLWPVLEMSLSVSRSALQPRSCSVRSPLYNNVKKLMGVSGNEAVEGMLTLHVDRQANLQCIIMDLMAPLA